MNLLKRQLFALVAFVLLYITSFAAHAINERLSFIRGLDERIVITVTGDSYNVCGEQSPVIAEIYTVEHEIALLYLTLPHQPIAGMILYLFPPVGRGFDCIDGATLRRYSYTLSLPIFPEGTYATRLSTPSGGTAARANLNTRAVTIPTIPTTSLAGIAALLMSIAGVAYLGLRRR